jgi:hypothetical protein
MKTQINIWNGSGWNHFAGLRELKSLKLGSRGLAARQGISKIEVSPTDSERPYGISARYFDHDGEEIFHQGFGQNDSAHWIKCRIYDLLNDGVLNRKIANRKKAIRAAFIQKISAWRRNFDAKQPVSNSIDKLSVKFHTARKNSLSEDFRPSRKLCTNLAWEVCAGRTTFKVAVAKITAAGGRF